MSEGVSVCVATKRLQYIGVVADIGNSRVRHPGFESCAATWGKFVRVTLQPSRTQRRWMPSGEVEMVFN